MNDLIGMGAGGLPRQNHLTSTSTRGTRAS